MEPSPSEVMPPPDLAPYIFEGESIVRIDNSPERFPTRAPSALYELYRLAQARVYDEVGEANPVFASLALETSDNDNDTTPEELKLYEALFGRDSLRVALDLLPIFPRLTRTTILSLAELQGVAYDASSEEEPGRIIHESRKPDDPIAKTLTETRGWHWPYYGSVDATPEFIRTISAYCQDDYEGTAFLFQPYQDKEGRSRIVADSLTFATNWLVKRLGSNPEGLLESLTSIPEGGIQNQVWKDSWDAYFHRDGQIANHQQGVASIEVQRVAYDALLDAAELYETALGRSDEAVALRERAATLRDAIFSLFWTNEKGGYFVLGTDRDANGNIRPLKLRTSNMGHMLHSRLLEGNDPQMKAYREAVVTQLFSPEMLAPSGIRTLANDEVRFRPGAYHNGSVWLWDTHFIVKGLRRHGYHHLADNLSERLFHIIETTRKFPEFVRGDDSPRPTLNTRTVDVWDAPNQRLNRIEQPPQEVQAWSVAAILAMKHYHFNSQSQQRDVPLDRFEEQILRSIMPISAV